MNRQIIKYLFIFNNKIILYHIKKSITILLNLKIKIITILHLKILSETMNVLILSCVIF